MSGKNVWVIQMGCNDNEEGKRFAAAVTAVTRQGFEIESCGMCALPSGYMKAWAILTKPERTEDDHA